MWIPEKGSRREPMLYRSYKRSSTEKLIQIARKEVLQESEIDALVSVARVAVTSELLKRQDLTQHKRKMILLTLTAPHKDDLPSKRKIKLLESSKKDRKWNPQDIDDLNQRILEIKIKEISSKFASVLFKSKNRKVHDLNRIRIICREFGVWQLGDKWVESAIPNQYFDEYSLVLAARLSKKAFLHDKALKINFLNSIESISDEFLVLGQHQEIVNWEMKRFVSYLRTFVLTKKFHEGVIFREGINRTLKRIESSGFDNLYLRAKTNQDALKKVENAKKREIEELKRVELQKAKQREMELERKRKEKAEDWIWENHLSGFMDLANKRAPWGLQSEKIDEVTTRALIKRGLKKYRNYLSFHEGLPISVNRSTGKTTVNERDLKKWFKSNSFSILEYSRSSGVSKVRVDYIPSAESEFVTKFSQFAKYFDFKTRFLSNSVKLKAVGDGLKIKMRIDLVVLPEERDILGGKLVLSLLRPPQNIEQDLGTLGWRKLSDSKILGTNSLEESAFKDIEDIWFKANKSGSELRTDSALLLEEVIRGVHGYSYNYFEFIVEDGTEEEKKQRRKILHRAVDRNNYRESRKRYRPYLAICQICELPLSDPISIQRGIGPDCWKKLQRKDLGDLRKYSDPSYDPLTSDLAMPLEEWLRALSEELLKEDF